MENPSSPNSVFSVSELVKPPRLIWEDVYSFPPNREILGGTSYFILNKAGNILVDCPPWRSQNQAFLQEQGGVRWLVLTHRGGISGDIATISQSLGCEIILQEQEAYLLPTLTTQTFHEEFAIAEDFTLLWTPGHSPGSSCLYSPRHGGILWTGRHLLPDRNGYPVPLRIAKTFHWLRQLENVAKLRDRFSADTLNFICPGANLGFLRGKTTIESAYEQLNQIDLEFIRFNQPLL